LTLAIAVGACALAAAVMAPNDLGGAGTWLVLVVSFMVLVVAFAVLWIVQKRRDHTLR
jgi:low temperature requirement protein LtrA